MLEFAVKLFYAHLLEVADNIYNTSTYECCLLLKAQTSKEGGKDPSRSICCRCEELKMIYAEEG